MVEYTCSVCKYKSSKQNISRHIVKKTTCGEGDRVMLSNVISGSSCEYCKKIFSTLPSMNRHIKICKVKKNNLEKENEKLKRENEILKALAKKPNTSITNNNININLAPWNNPLLPDDVEKYYREAVKKIFLAIPTLIKYIHFNTEHPENHNICIKNARSKTAKVYNGKEWETINEDELISSLITDYENTLEDYSENEGLKYNEKMRQIKDRDTEEKVYDDLHDEIKRVIYDRNHMIKVKK